MGDDDLKICYGQGYCIHSLTIKGKQYTKAELLAIIEAHERKECKRRDRRTKA